MESEYIYEKYENETAICGYLGKYAHFSRSSGNKNVLAVSNLYYKSKADTVTAKSVGISSKRTAYPYIEKLIVGDDIKNIKCYAFCGSRNLEFAEIDGKDKNVEDGIFMDCTKLKAVTLGSWGKSIPSYTFKGCCSLSSITFQAPPENIGKSAFEKCVNMRNIDLSHVVSVGRRSFFGCMSIEKIVFEKLKELSSLAFAECSSLSEIEIGECENIGSDIFKGSFAISKITVTAEKVDIEKLLASINKEIILSIVSPRGVTTITLPLQFSEYKNCLNKCTFDFCKYDEISIKNKNIKAAFERTEINTHLTKARKTEYIKVLHDNIRQSAEYALKNNKIDLLFSSGAVDSANISEIRHILGETAEYRAYLIDKSEESMGKKYDL